MLRAELTKQLGGFSLDCTIEAEPGRTLVLVGESGSGKTTVLRLLAGLLQPDAGHIASGGQVWCDTRTGKLSPPEDRPIGYVPQDYALFPHLSVLENVAFGLRATGAHRREAHAQARDVIRRFGIEALAGRTPAQLSGGQQQRVALARALALEPEVLLLDEPLAALDAETRNTVRGELRRLLASLPCVTVFVTHAPLEALVFGDRIAVLEHGRVAQVGDQMTLLRQPRSRYVATLVGLNLLPGRVRARDPGGAVTLETPRGLITVMDAAPGDQLFVAVSPEQVFLSLEPPEGSARNVFVGAVEELVPEPPFGDRIRVVLGPDPPFFVEITAAAARQLQLAVGRRVYAAFKATSVAAYA
ncbi:MAG TPA: ABC transporter ATP-binding protein [Gemmatimonadales bacterium]|jgi:molybdate transport system ATP-binding protein